MSLDFKLIDTATSYSIDKLNLLNLGGSEVCLLVDFLHPTLVTKLVEYVESTTNWYYDPVYGTAPRTKINWEQDSVVEETHIVFNNLTDVLNLKFDRHSYFHGITLWRDLPGYSIPPHKDNKAIDFAIQIYLSGGIDGLGTVFEHDGTTITADYKINSGYLADNRVGVTHSLPHAVPTNHTRYSLYVTWSTTPKAK